MADSTKQSVWKKVLPYLLMALIASLITAAFFASYTEVDKVTGQRSFKKPKEDKKG